MRASSARRLAVWLYTLVWAVFYAGILAHTSSGAALAGKYSYKYLAALALGLVPFAFPRALRKMREALGSWRRVFFAFVPALVLALTGYVLAEKVYYATRFYPFHPFLQVPPRRSITSQRINKPAPFALLRWADRRRATSASKKMVDIQRCSNGSSRSGIQQLASRCSMAAWTGIQRSMH